MNPKYPIYIISKGRHESRLTAKALTKIGVPFHIVIEPQEYKDYASVIDPKKILVLPFSNLGQGSIPARNWVWQHSIEAGAKRHWIMDDNIRAFYRFNNNRRNYVSDGAIFKAAEDFTDRYENVPKSGLNYRMFVSDRQENIPPFYLNTRVYSCILLSNEEKYNDFRWRGRYNEDTDLSIRFLKAGFCTILFNAFLADKIGTLTMKGGNTESLYLIKEGEKDGRYLMAESLQKQHPDIVKITRKWGRWQHHVDYRGFKNNTLIKRTDIEINEGVNNYGMNLVKLK